MDEEIPNYVERPWDCENLDPFRDDPEALPENENEEEVEVESQPELSDISLIDSESQKCSCQNCPQMPTKEEQVCCKDVKTWQQEYKSEGTYTQTL